MKPSDSVTSLKGVGPKKAEALARLKIFTLEDLMMLFPRSYEDRSVVVNIADLAIDQKCLIKGRVTRKYANRYGRKQRLVLKVADATGGIEVVFFNAVYVSQSIREGDEYLFYGKVTENRGRLQMIHPETEKDDGRRGLVPVYPLTKGITQNEMRKLQTMISGLYSQIEEMLPEDMLETNRLCPMKYALENIHFPTCKQMLQEARYRFIYDELLVLQTGLFAVRCNMKNKEKGIGLNRNIRVDEYVESLGYQLTGAQQRCIDEIISDMESSQVMNRLVQGDVGSGKTVVAEVAMYKTAMCGYQAVMMAPTEILAKQHYEGFVESFGKHSIKVGLLTGSMGAAERRRTIEGVTDGEIQILVGTHAVIQEDVVFENLGLVVTDEQHRFGVNQRIALKEKGNNPNVLVMTATPIPRTLAVILYGDLDVSVIDELPPGRQQIDTKCMDERERIAVYDFAEEQIRNGGQVYVVAPLIEESEVVDARSAEEIYEELRERFDNYNVTLLHGGMKQVEKDRIMNEFADGDIDVLVATVVIEVGINVPNANVMIIENAERFGLAQLHQLRGRVGRGSRKSYCRLIMCGNSEIARRRGHIMEESTDGFFIAEEDLKLRGPGEIFGTRQHGLPDLNISDLARHIRILNHAKECAADILKEDPEIETLKYSVLRRRITKFFGEDCMLNL
ncbi:MAG: ATP-dependent DNA helicase RecG [Bacillota bacterium]|nr:ATP-dependent DNA helicase RecG [Bacillota bacterium]